MKQQTGIYMHVLTFPFIFIFKRPLTSCSSAQLYKYICNPKHTASLHNPNFHD